MWYTTYVCNGILTLVHVYTCYYGIPHTCVLEYYSSSCIHLLLWYTTNVCNGILTLVHIYTRSYGIPHTYVMEYLH